ncbi:MAG: hypothetical protein C4293_06550 [Nitrospiraceae bacterium]
MEFTTFSSTISKDVREYLRASELLLCRIRDGKDLSAEEWHLIESYMISLSSARQVRKVHRLG